MLVDENDRFLTQRQLPRMALLRTSIDGNELHVTGPQADRLTLPLRPTWSELTRVRVWRSELEASVAGNAVSAWFGDFLGKAVRLVYMRDDQHRRVAANRAARREDEVSFADGAPIMLIGEGSLADLNERLGAPVTMLRFRPNIVVDTATAFAEDAWRRIRIAQSELEVAWACARCTITTVDPETGTLDAAGEPLATLREYRRDGAGVFFGQNLLPRGGGTISVGDAVEVLE